MKAPEPIKPNQQHFQQQQQQQQQQQNHHAQQSSTNRVGVFVNKKRHVQEHQQQTNRKTTHQMLAEAQRQAVSFDNSSLNIINGSHVKQQVATKKSTAFTRLSRPQPVTHLKQKAPPKPQRTTKAVPQGDVYQSIKVSTKGGVITLFADNEHEKTMEASEEFKSHIASSMYGQHQRQNHTNKPSVPPII